jgi:hypothetical protein
MSQTEGNKTYRWGYPSDWLGEKLDTLAAEGNVVELKSIANELLRNCAEDDIQDVFQVEMEADGYFKPLKKASAGRTKRT